MVEEGRFERPAVLGAGSVMARTYGEQALELQCAVVADIRRIASKLQGQQRLRTHCWLKTNTKVTMKAVDAHKGICIFLHRRR